MEDFDFWIFWHLKASTSLKTRSHWMSIFFLIQQAISQGVRIQWKVKIVLTKFFIWWSFKRWWSVSWPFVRKRRRRRRCNGCVRREVLWRRRSSWARTSGCRSSSETCTRCRRPSWKKNYSLVRQSFSPMKSPLNIYLFHLCSFINV